MDTLGHTIAILDIGFVEEHTYVTVLLSPEFEPQID